MPETRSDQQIDAREMLGQARMGLSVTLAHAYSTGLDIDDVAEALGLPPRTVRSINHNWGLS